MRERNEAIVKGVDLQLEHQRRRLEQENSNNSNSKTEQNRLEQKSKTHSTLYPCNLIEKKNIQTKINE